MRQPKPQTSGARRQVYRCVGYTLFLVGLAGTVLPVLPTTVFWILAALCFARSSPAMYRRITTWPRLGATIADFLDEGAISTRGKAAALSGMALGLAVAAYILGTGWPLVLVFGGIALSALYVLARPTPSRQRS